MKRLSISLRLTIWYASISALGLAIFGVVMWFVLASSMLSWKDRTLQMRAARTEAALKSASPGSAAPDSQRVVNQRLEDVIGSLPEGEWIEVVGTDGRLLFPLTRVTGLPSSPAPCGSALYRDILVNRERFRELCRPVLYQGRAAALLVPSPLSEDRILLGNFTAGLYRMIPILLLVSGLGGYMLSRRALAPVDVVIAEASAITAQDLSRRLSLPSADDQLRRLSVEWNNLLARIETAVIRVTQFTADASHELRSPIAFIRTAAEFQLGNPALDEEQREVFAAILQETILTTEMLEGLLLLARLDAEGVPLLVPPVDLYALTADLALHFEPALRKRHQELKLTHPAAAAPMLRMAASHLRRVLTAILENAIKYTPDAGKIRLEIENHDGVSLRITDTGQGIAGEHLGRVFDRFFRVDQARTTVKEGVGLGLAIAKRLMEQYGGTISVASQVGIGTSVLLTFPAALLHADGQPYRVQCLALNHQTR